MRTIFGLNEVMSELLWNQFLNHNIDPLMPRTQQVKIILRLDAEAKTRVSTRENIDDTAEHVTAYRIESKKLSIKRIDKISYQRHHYH